MMEKQSSVKLVGIRKGDVGAPGLPNSLKVGDTFVCCGKKMKVKAVTGGRMKEQVHGGTDLIYFST